MPRKRKRPHVAHEALEAALAGLGSLRIEELLTLIRGINPSRLELEADERRRRYELKGRLQSELLRRFADQLELVPTAERGVFGIRRRGARGDGGHARLDRLDADVQGFAMEALARRRPSRTES